MPATGQNIYKCADGYSQQPCAGGVPVQAGDTRTGEQKAQADAATRRDARTAAALEKDRLAREAQAVPPYTPPPRAGAQADAAPRAKDSGSASKGPAVFKAVAPAKPGDKKPEKKKPGKKER